MGGPLTKAVLVDLAGEIRVMLENCPKSHRGTVKTVAVVIAGVCSRHNPLFDKARFFKACGLNQETI